MIRPSAPQPLSPFFRCFGPKEFASIPPVKTRAFIWYWFPVLVWMAIIFSASSDQQSFQHSSRFLGPLINWLFPHISDQSRESLILFVRKLGHLSEYAVLSLLVWRAFRRSSNGNPQPWDSRVAFRAVFVAMLYAATDEFHQAFVPTRQASILDVLLDTAGAAIAMLVLWAFMRWRTKKLRSA